MRATQTLIDLNREYLRQGQRLILDMSDQVYAGSYQPHSSSSVGDHVRHVIEHYQRFLIGHREGEINYDARQRDERISEDRNFACSVIEQVVQGLKEMSPSDEAIKVKMAVSADGTRDVPLTDSSVNRELQYLQAHTIHHYALIALLLKVQGEDPPSDFGFAPSTLQHVHRD